MRLVDLKVGFIGCVATSEFLLKRVAQEEGVEVVGVITRRQSLINSDFVSLESAALSINAPVLFADGVSQEEQGEWLKARNPDVVFCFGWSYLLKSPLLVAAPRGVVGFHPTALPANRGRHPLIWALVLGLEKTASSFFFMDEGADSGPIVSQRPVPIHLDDDASTLMGRVTQVALQQISDLCRQFRRGDVPIYAQDDAAANVWRKRHPVDGRIDWRMSGEAIRNLVRGLTRPYVGAHVEGPMGEFKVWKMRLSSMEGGHNIEPGKVLGVRGKDVIVKCGDGAVVLEDHEFAPLPSAGDYL
jgi:methionyl-tRNA formyltransferase